MKSSENNGMDFGLVLLTIFVVLKLVGSIAWSWWWVLSPLWIPFVLIFFNSILKTIKIVNDRKK